MRHAPSQSRHSDEARRQWELGQVHAKAARWDAAASAHQRAARLAPSDAVYALNHARALFAQGKFEQAGDEALRAFRLDPGQCVAPALAARCMMRQHRYAEVVNLLRTLDANWPRDHEYHTTLATALLELRRYTEAIAAFMDALALKPSYAPHHHNLGLCFRELEMGQEAAQCFNTALLLEPGANEIATRAMACMAQRAACHWQDIEANLAALRVALLKLPASAAAPTTPFTHAVLSADRGEQLRAAVIRSRFVAAEVTPLPPRRSQWKPGARRLRVGYVSADFHAHATTFLMAEMLELHDRERFDVRLYSHRASDGTEMRARIEAACEEFVDVLQMTDAQAAQRIRADGIDILIDLKGHTRDNRLAIFAHHPAPVQASFLGYPGTAGADYIDYLIGDPLVTPLAHAADYSEKIAQLPLCYQPNDRQRPLPEPPSRASQGLPEDALVLCAINQTYKISPAVMDSWCRVLQALPNAVLWLLEWGAQALPNLRREAALRGVAPQRLISAPQVPLPAHIARLRLADLFVDTWPCNAHTSASDALWAGVPLVTLPGETFASRVGASLLHAVGTPELVCRDVAHYEATIVELAGDVARRRALRERLEQARSNAPLFDSQRFTRDIEALYMRMATRHAEGLAPEHLPANP